MKKKVLICSFMPKNEYSGGRYHAWMMIEALASCGHQVTAWTNNVPAFLEDFSTFPAHNSIKIECSSYFLKLPDGIFDVVIVVPHMGGNYDFYIKAFLLARKFQARLVLLNFESPNWYNQLSPKPRDPYLWNYWVETSRVADMILSSAAESTRFAKDFYQETLSWTLFRHCYPSINSLVADRVASVTRERQVICITRFILRDKHKGGDELLKAIGLAMKGYTIAIVVGSGEIDSDLKEKLLEKANQFEVTVRFLYKLSDREKFQEIKRSSLMLFLSYFEGFGYPPVEAQYCDTPCIVYDLPVLREVSGEGLIYVPPGDTTALQEAIYKVLSGEYQPPFSLKEHIAPVARFEAFAIRLNTLIQELEKLPYKPAILSKPAIYLRSQLILLLILNTLRKVLLFPVKALRKILSFPVKATKKILKIILRVFSTDQQINSKLE